ncbi:hypothetical protein P8452_46226 [Trifolium repens]|nr:hypothetical protein P8452_46226 [Trifolium repens]
MIVFFDLQTLEVLELSKEIKEKLKEADKYDLEGLSNMRIQALEIVEELRIKRADKQMEFTDSLGFTIRRRLHPAMYRFALACQTFDLEYAKTSKKTFTDAVEAHMFRILHWCRKLAK